MMKGLELSGAGNSCSGNAIGPYERSLELPIADSVSASGATAGTLNIGASGEAIVVVIAAKRAN